VARCLADRTGGQYLSTENTDELVAALKQTLGCPIYGQKARWWQRLV
jgi:Ca-activated chloride channel family protein